jgi:RNA-binding protein
MLTKDQKKYLRTLLHNRGTIIWIGQNGLTGKVLAELETALDHHELVKIRIRNGDSKSRDQVAREIGERTGAELIQKIGNMVSVFRANRRKRVIKLPE